MAKDPGSEKEAPQLSVRTSASKKQVGRAVSINGVHAVDIHLKNTQNINDPILDVGVRVNNPLGRILLALKRIWKTQNTIIALKFTIPLIVLPIVLFVGWRVWQGRGMSEPMSKLGVLHEVSINGSYKDILILPTSDVYMLEYADEDIQRKRVLEKKVIVIGMFNTVKNTLTVDDLITYEGDNVTPPEPEEGVARSIWSAVVEFFQQFR